MPFNLVFNPEDVSEPVAPALKFSVKDVSVAPPLVFNPEDVSVERPSILTDAQKGLARIGEMFPGVPRSIAQIPAIARRVGVTMADVGKEIWEAKYGQYGPPPDVEPAAQQLLQEAETIEKEAEIRWPRQYKGVEDIQNVGDIAGYTKQLLEENVPLLLGSFGTGALARGVAARTLTKKRGAEILQGKAAQKLLQKAEEKGLAAGAAALGTAYGVSSVVSEQEKAGVDRAPSVTVPAAIVMGQLEKLPILTLAKQLGLARTAEKEVIAQLAKKGVIARMAGGLVVVGTQEAITESLQEVTAIVARKIVDPAYELMGEEAQRRMLNAAVGGFLPGGIMGGVAGAIQRPAGIKVSRKDVAAALALAVTPAITPVAAAEPMGAPMAMPPQVTPTAAPTPPPVAMPMPTPSTMPTAAMPTGVVAPTAATAPTMPSAYEGLSPDAIQAKAQEILAGALQVPSPDIFATSSISSLLPSTTSRLDINRPLQGPPASASEALARILPIVVGPLTARAVQNTLFDSPLQAGTVATFGFARTAEETQELENAKKDLAQAVAPEVIVSIRQYMKQEALRIIVRAERGENLRQLTQSVLQKIAPDMKIVLSAGGLRKTAKHLGIRDTGTARGSSLRLADGTVILELSAQTHDFLSGKASAKEKGQALNTYWHELGHAVVKHFWHTADQRTKDAVWGEYSTYLLGLLDRPILDFLRGATTPASFELRVDELQKSDMLNQTLADFLKMQYKRKLQIMPPEVAANEALYLIDFDEYLAEQFAMWAARRAVPTTLAQQFYAKAVQALRNIYAQTKAIGKPHQMFEAWMESQVLRQKGQAQITTGGVTLAVPVEVEFAAKMLGERIASFGSDEQQILNSLVRFNKFTRWMLSLTQNIQRNRGVPGGQEYLERVHDWWSEKGLWTTKATQRLREWPGNKTEKARYANLLLEATQKSDLLARRLTTAELQKLFQKHNLSVRFVAHYFQLDNDFRSALDELYSVLKKDAETQFSANPVALQNAVQELDKEFENLKDRNYFPQPRFGAFWVRVQKKGVTTAFYTYESRRDMEQALQDELSKGKAFDEIITGGKFSEEVRVFQGMPRLLVKALQDRLTLTPEQTNELALMLHELAPGQSYKKHLIRRKGIAGFSTDVQRAYGSYFMHFSNHIARVKHSGDMLDAIKRLENHIKDLSNEHATQSVEVADLLSYLRRHYDYMMNPGEEWSNLKAIAFLVHLGLVPISAAANLAQLPLVTFPHLSKQYGYVKAAKYLIGSSTLLRQSWTKRAKLSLQLNAAITRGIEAGPLSESQAKDLASLSEGSTLARLLPGTWFGRAETAQVLRTASTIAAFSFHVTEQTNRYITFVAAWQLAIDTMLKQTFPNERKRQLAIEQLTPELQTTLLDAAYRKALESTQTTQLIYARWDQAEFMRGRAGALTIFMKYPQGMLHFVYADPARWRYLVLLGLTVGLKGLPGAEDIMKMIDFGGTKLREMLGLPNPKVTVELEIRKQLKGINVDPDLFLHGTSYYAFGLPGLADKLGLTFPEVNLGAPLSMGNIIPGLDALLGPSKDFSTTVGRTGADAVGAFFAIPLNIMQALGSDEPNLQKRWERAMPTEMRNLSKAERYFTEGKEIDAGGHTVVHFDVRNPQHLAEIVAQTLGAPPTRLRQEQEARRMEYEAGQYWMTRRGVLTRQWVVAMESEDREVLADANAAIEKYNATVPYSQLVLSGKTLGESRKAFRMQEIKEAAGVSGGIRLRPLKEEIEQTFREP